MGKYKYHKFRDHLSGFLYPILQVFKSISRKQSDVIIFLVLPVIFLLNASAIHYHLGPFFLGIVDPEYFYLYNGLILSGGNLSIQYFIHPGTPLHFMIAISSRIISLFQTDDYVRGFIDDPEKFIHAANLLMNVLISFTLFICGIYTKKYSGSYFSGILIQLSPFGSSDLWGLTGRLIPESLLMIPLLLTGLMIIKFIYDENKTNGYITYFILFSLIIGFGIACKLYFIPVLLIPLILIPVSVKQKFKLILYSVLFIAVFAYPIVFNFNEFWHWVSGINTHSGKFSVGDNNFIDFKAIFRNMKYLFTSNREFFYVAGSSLVVSMIVLFNVLKKKDFTSLKIIRAIFAVNVAILVCMAFTLMYFKPYYFMPFTVFKYLLVLLSILLILRYHRISNSKSYRSIVLILSAVIILFMTYGQVRETRYLINRSIQRSATLQQEYRKITSLVDKDNPIIITGPYYGAPFIEFAHFNGFSMSNHLKGFFSSYLKEKYPKSYQYVSWSDKFDFWDDFVDFDHILDKTKTSFYIYIGKGKGNDLAEIENRIWQFLDKNSITRKVLYQDINSDEQLIEIIIYKE